MYKVQIVSKNLKGCWLYKTTTGFKYHLEKVHYKQILSAEDQLKLGEPAKKRPSESMRMNDSTLDDLVFLKYFFSRKTK